MAKIEVLTGPAIGPDGDRVEGGARPPDTWPGWFLDDLRTAGILIPGNESPAHRRTNTPAKKTVTGTSNRARRSS